MKPDPITTSGREPVGNDRGAVEGIDVYQTTVDAQKGPEGGAAPEQQPAPGAGQLQ